MSMFTIILMLAAAAVMIFGLMKSKQGVPWGKPVTIAGAVAVLLLALGTMLDGGQSADKLRNITERYHEIKGTKLGRYMAANFEGQSAAFLLPYQNGEELDTNTIAFMDSLREELSPAAEITGQMTPKPPPEVRRQQEAMRKEMEEMAQEDGEEALPPEEMMFGLGDMYSWFTGRQLDALIADYDKECDLLIAICDLPSTGSPARFWGRSNAPKVVLTNGSVYEYYRHIKAGNVIAAIAHNPNADYQEKPAKDLDKAFNQRYLLITPDNVDEITEKYPKLLNTSDD